MPCPARFWQAFHDAGLSDEQIKVLNRLLDVGEKGFESGISESQYQEVAKVSKATATRHLSDLLNKGGIEKLPGGGRSTRYQDGTQAKKRPSNERWPFCMVPGAGKLILNFSVTY
ncbi:hypothetical protein [Endozoicomonas lisbonensis]|uniref:DNA-binding transcriptional ArsR family regulator n=1 Tax=Endozoicomonas lisbonensis TaxID=3120522 RepID=A0ABV2SQL9_9GAMM